MKDRSFIDVLNLVLIDENKGIHVGEIIAAEKFYSMR
jgi:hypothetical protein